MLTLYNIALSGNSYRVRLLLALIGQPCHLIDVRMHGGDGPPPELATLNPLREAPVLVEGDLALRDSQAMLVYLARRFAPAWYPDDSVSMGRIAQWLSIAANEIQNGPRMARGIRLGVVKGDFDKASMASHRLFAFVDAHLTDREWLECDRPTIADVACYPYLWNAGDAGLDIAPYSAMRAWLRRVEALPGFVPMQPEAAS
jgi:glutathione S-transferase